MIFNKEKTLASIFLLGLILLFNFPTNAQELSPIRLIQACNKAKNIKDKFKDKIQAPYHMEGNGSKAILCGEPDHEAIIPVSVIGKQRYRIYFHHEGFEGNVFVKISTLNKKIVFTNEDDPSKDLYSFVAPRTEKYFVQFVYTMSKNPDAVGCVSVAVASREF